MAWDLSTDPGFQERLDWMRAFVREELWPLRQTLRGYQPPPDGVPGEHVPTRREAARRKFAAVLDAVAAND